MSAASHDIGPTYAIESFGQALEMLLVPLVTFTCNAMIANFTHNCDSLACACKTKTMKFVPLSVYYLTSGLKAVCTA